MHQQHRTILATLRLRPAGRSLRLRAMLTDIAISAPPPSSQSPKSPPGLSIPPEAVEPYGHFKAKIDLARLPATDRTGKLILVTAISPTPAGEGKSTTSVGLADGLNRIGRKTVLCLREPSLGPCFGTKGGAAGGGYAQVGPMEDINLHFTGDFHAITHARITCSRR